MNSAESRKTLGERDGGGAGVGEGCAEHCEDFDFYYRTDGELLESSEQRSAMV